MGEKTRILTVNPGSTSTKIALFDDKEELFRETIYHRSEDLKKYPIIQDQLEFRRDMVANAVTSHGYKLEEIDVFAGRGGGVVSVEGGTYEVTELLVKHAEAGMAEPHPAQLASQICKYFADRFNKKAYTVNPPDVDEFCGVARVSGLKGVYRESHVHALNQKEVALRYCELKGKKYCDINLVICHLGGGVSITAHQKGSMIDANDTINGSGPMTPTRAGDIAFLKIVELAYSGEYTKAQLRERLNRSGGIADHFGTSDVRDVIKLVDGGDKYAKIILDGMIYQCAKYAGAMAVALRGKVDAVIITGGIANSDYFTREMKSYISWISEVFIMPGEFELEALAAGVLRVLKGEEKAKIYTGIPVWNGF